MTACFAGAAGLLHPLQGRAGVTTVGDTSQITDNGDNTYINTPNVSYTSLTAGYSQFGSIGVDEGSTLYSQPIAAGFIATMIGQLQTASGSITVSGQGSTLISQGDLCAGDSGSGSLGITDGGSAYAVDASIGGAVPGHDGTGSILVDGSGSTLFVDETLSVGNGGVGTLTIKNTPRPLVTPARSPDSAAAAVMPLSKQMAS